MIVIFLQGWGGLHYWNKQELGSYSRIESEIIGEIKCISALRQRWKMGEILVHRSVSIWRWTSSWAGRPGTTNTKHSISTHMFSVANYRHKHSNIAWMYLSFLWLTERERDLETLRSLCLEPERERERLEKNTRFKFLIKMAWIPAAHLNKIAWVCTRLCGPAFWIFGQGFWTCAQVNENGAPEFWI